MNEADPTLRTLDVKLVGEFRQGSRRALARLITRLDNGEDPRPWLAALEGPQTDATRVTRPGSPRVIGVTGPPGAGKSSLIGSLIPAIRARKLSVAVLAVDPDSPYTGGAILGDRIRMGRHRVGDAGVYIRSLSTRGSAGGLSRTTRSICRLVAAFGFDLILLETVGAGQAELSVMDAADLVALVLNPGAGDGVQWEKAGQMEIADLFVLNKADLPGIDALESALRSALDPGYPAHCPAEPGHAGGVKLPTPPSFPRHRSLWDGPPPLLRTIVNRGAHEGDGVEAVLDKMIEGLARVGRTPDAWTSPLRRRLRAGLEEEFERRMRQWNTENQTFEAFVDEVRRGAMTLDEAIQQAWRRLHRNGGIHKD